eukprot:scaffold345_cov134-Cylindrotheca_fusiformis.AAC.8
MQRINLQRPLAFADPIGSCQEGGDVPFDNRCIFLLLGRAKFARVLSVEVRRAYPVNHISMQGLCRSYRTGALVKDPTSVFCATDAESYTINGFAKHHSSTSYNHHDFFQGVDTTCVRFIA